MVQTGQTAWIRRGALSIPWGTWGIRVPTGPIFSVEFAAAIPVFETDALAIVPIDTVDGRDTLHDGADTSYPRGDDVTHARLCILVDAGSQTVDAEVWGKIAIIVLFPEQVDVRLEGGNGICKVGELDGAKEDAAACRVVVVEVLFALKTKVQEVQLSKAEDIVGIGPVWNLNWYHRVKLRDGQFQDTPQVVISVIGFVMDRGERSVDLRGEGARYQARE